MAVLSGAIHLDGLADTADALGRGTRSHPRAGDSARQQDRRFGAIALFFALGLKVLALASLSGKSRLAALILAPMLARWALVAVSYKIDYLRSSGAGSSMLGRGIERNLAIASIVAIVAHVALPLVASDRHVCNRVRINHRDAMLLPAMAGRNHRRLDWRVRRDRRGPDDDRHRVVTNSISLASDSRPPSGSRHSRPPRFSDWSIRADRENAARSDCPERCPRLPRRSRRLRKTTRE